MIKKIQTITRAATLAHHLEAELKRQQLIENYYKKTLEELKSEGGRLQNLGTKGGNVSQKNNVNVSRLINQENVSGFMDKSQVSVILEHQSKIAPNKSKVAVTINKMPQKVNYQAQYDRNAQQLSKTMLNINQKQQNTQGKKDLQKTNKSNSILLSRSIKSPKLVQTKSPLLALDSKLKTQKSGEKLTKKEQIMQNLGNNTLLNSTEDEIINNLLQKLRIEEEKYIDNLLLNTQLSIKEKMKNHLGRQCQKYEQFQFKQKQQQIEKVAQKRLSNRETVKRGYTDKMKDIVDKGLRKQGSEFKQNVSKSVFAVN